MLLIEVNLSLEQKRKLLRMSKMTGKTFGQLASQALAEMLDEAERATVPAKVITAKGQASQAKETT